MVVTLEAIVAPVVAILREAFQLTKQPSRCERPAIWKLSRPHRLILDSSISRLLLEMAAIS